MTPEPTRSRTLDPASADLTIMQDRQVAVLGYGSVLAAHALNLRDSGVDVRVGLPADGRAAARAEVEGLLVVSPEDAVAQADLIVLPPEADLTAFAEPLRAGLEVEDLVVLTSPEALRFSGFAVPDGVDLGFLRTLGGADRLRGEHLDGRGVPALVGVTVDASGAAWATLTAYAAALGALRAGALIVDPLTVAESDRFAASALGGTIRSLVREAFAVLVEDGIAAEVAYLACQHEAHELLHLGSDAGWPHAPTPDQPAISAEYVREALQRAWADVRVTTRTEPPSAVVGSSDAEAAGGYGSRAEAARAEPSEAVGREVRALMSWVR